MTMSWSIHVCVILVITWCTMPIWMRAEAAKGLYDNGISISMKRSAGVIGLAVKKGIKAVQYLLYEAQLVTRRNNAGYFRKSGGSLKAILDFQNAVEPRTVRSMHLTEETGRRLVGEVGDRLLILRYGSSIDTTLEVHRIGQVSKRGETTWHTPKLTEKIYYTD